MFDKDEVTCKGERFGFPSRQPSIDGVYKRKEVSSLWSAEDNWETQVFDMNLALLHSKNGIDPCLSSKTTFANNIKVKIKLQRD